MLKKGTKGNKHPLEKDYMSDKLFDSLVNTFKLLSYKHCLLIKFTGKVRVWNKQLQ